MALIKISGSAENITSALTRLEQLGRNPNRFLAALGDQMVTNTSDRIDTGISADGTPFAPLNPFYAATKPAGLPILVSSGRLRHDLTTAIHGNTLLWGSNEKYAAVHQFGAVIKPTARNALIFSMGGHTFTRRSVTIPARPYLGFNADDRAQALDTLGGFFRAVLRG